jgi:hypothetical protein
LMELWACIAFGIRHRLSWTIVLDIEGLGL